ncbi:MAG: UDP-N-acetylmuramoyl-L-alanyl-D-glutamate--2,6-diaminopimelate ligase [Bacilli bacterium]|nr:UDP-N-acetylmuramoyl-L-alanyl-D-glutamate--2,6-diaminopimelate ligase [Bacilli bacterium]
MKDDSRKVSPGDTFISLTGKEEYIKDAINNGASKVIVENGLYSVDTLIVNNTHEYLENYLDNIYKDKLSKIKLIGITGTNGKTTSAYLLWQILNKLDIKCGYIGTIGFFIKDKVKDLNNTTPDTLDIYDMINICINEGCKYLVMEVSSQALSYNRIGKLMYDYAVFTNLSQDHLDYHKDMYNYALAKQKLFNHVKGKAIINYDDNNKSYFLLDNENITFGFDGGDYHITKYNVDKNLSEFTLNDILYKTNLIGKYNIYNLLISIIILDLEGITYDKEMFENLEYPKGRMEVIKYKNNKIIVDYAHTPEAIENILKTVKELEPKNIITIIGAGGDRDSSKRSIMGSVSTKLSNYVIFTNDNPRTENPNSILNDIVQKVDTSNYEIIPDRKKAIIKGIQMLEENDILLVLGKGHEEYQIIGKEKVHFSDIEIINANI